MPEAQIIRLDAYRPAPRGLLIALRNAAVPSVLLWAGIIWGVSRLIGGLS